MQLTSKKLNDNKHKTDKLSKKGVDIKAALTIATTALLGVTNQASAQEQDNWEFDTAFLYYSEVDRVSAAEAILNANKLFKNDQILNLKLTIDVLTGASANGAVAQPDVQTFSRPSGNGVYQIAPGDTPLDDTFKDTRVQFNGQWTQPLWQDYTVSSGVHISKEYDYLSLGINSNLAIDFNQKNTTLSVGGSYFYDTIEPEGGIPVPFASMVYPSDDTENDDFDQSRLMSDDDKTTIDLLFGITQIINRQMIMQFNYSYSVVDGYLTDPFKILSLVDSDGIAQDYLYEHRPDERTKHSAFVQSKYHFDAMILDLSYRYMWDDWEIKSHTIDSRYRFELSGDSYLEPHIRFYQQDAAEFYRPFLNENEGLPEFASADYRIGEMTTYTVGVKYGTVINQGNELSFRLEYYRQDPKSAGFTEQGVLADLELYESVDAIIGQVTYSF